MENSGQKFSFAILMETFAAAAHGLPTLAGPAVDHFPGIQETGGPEEEKGAAGDAEGPWTPTFFPLCS